MHVLEVIDVNEAYAEGLRLLLNKGERQSSRAGDVYSLQEPLAVKYLRPQQRVLLDPSRDANPFFHLFEALWLLAGRNDARWLDRFVGDFSARFAEEDGHLHGSYGFRWRRHFDLDGEGNPNMPDQLDTVVRLLKANPYDRRVVIQMWDCVADLGQPVKDVPCNLLAIPRIVNGALNLTVFNRSNDLIWGLTGANAVQFSILQEYLAGRIGVGIGEYEQITTNAHLYVSRMERLQVPVQVAFYPGTAPMGTIWDKWDADLKVFMAWADAYSPPFPSYPAFANSWFAATACPLFEAVTFRRFGKYQEALDMLKALVRCAPDWKEASIAWMGRRLVRMVEKNKEATHAGV